MNSWTATDFLLLGIALAALGKVYEKVRSKKLPVVTEDDFLAHFQGSLAQEHTANILRERRNIARTLGVPVERLSPTATFSSIIKRVNYLGSANLAYSDLVEDLQDNLIQANIDIDPSELETVGAFIQATIQSLARASKSGAVQVPP